MKLFYQLMTRPASWAPTSFTAGLSVFRRKTKYIFMGMMLLGYFPYATAQDITFSPTSLAADANVDDFDNVSFEITNNSGVELEISSITITGPDADQFSFSSGNFGDPPYILDASGLGTSIEFYVVFAPTSAGTRHATLNVFLDSSASPHTLSLLGTSEVAIEPDLDITVTNQPTGGTVFDLLSINVGEPDTITATIRNLGNTDLNISELQLSDGGSQFQFVTDFSLPLVIAPSDSVTIDIQASATYPISIPSPGISSIGATLGIAHDDPNETSPSVTQLKFFERAPDPVIGVSELNFGNVPTGTDSTLSFTISNQSIDSRTDGELIITGFDFGVEADLFSSTSVFPITLATGESASLNLTFSPDTFETTNTTITVAGNVDKSLNILGQGAIKLLDVGAGTLDFGSAHKSEGQVPASFNISVTGGQSVTISSASFTGADANNFETFLSFPRSVSGTSEFLVSFFPGASGPGPKNATLTLHSDATNSPHVIEITADAIYPPILTTPGPITFAMDRLIATDTTFIVTNTGTEALNINSYSFSPASSTSGISFVDYPAFPLTLAGGEALPITVRFSPTELDDLYAEVNIVSPNNSTGTLKVVTLLADVMYPVAFIANEFDLPLDSLRFGGVSTAGIKTDSLLVVNEGPGDLVITNINLSGLMSVDFSLPGVVYPILIAPDSSTKIPVQFAPAVAQRRFASLTMESNNVPEALAVGLTGHGTQPLLSFFSTISAGRAAIGHTTQVTKELKNIGDVPVNVYSYNFTGTDVALFGMSGLETPAVLEPDSTIAITFTFTPVADGIFSAQLELVTDAVNGPITSTISATGFSSPEFFTEYDTFRVAKTNVGEISILKIPIENRGTLDLELISAGLQAGSVGFFSTNGFGLPLTIAPGAVDSLEVLFSPKTGGEHMGFLTIQTNDNTVAEDEPTTVADLYLIGDAAGPIPSFSVTELDFDSTFVGFEKRLSFEVTNIGETDLNIDFLYPEEDSLFNVYYQGYDTPPVAGSFIPFAVPAGATQTIHVVFMPTELGVVHSSVHVAIRDITNTRHYTSFPVTGIGAEPPVVKIGALTIVGDDFQRVGNIKTLLGNVHIGDLELGDEVVVDLANSTIAGEGNVFVTDVPPKGALAGGTVTLRTGGFKYYVDGADSTLSVDPNDVRGKNFFEIIGLELEINDLVITEAGVRAGGHFALPEAIFGADAGFNMDKVLISKEAGTDIAGKFAIEAPMTVFDIFSLESVVLEFDSFNDCFTGAGSVSTDGGAFELSIDAEVVLKNGGLDGISLEVETFPGVPLGSTGFALAGGNGAIAGLQVPPVSIELGVDLIPVAPGANKVIRFDNVGFKYTFGTSLTAGGTLMIYGMSVAEAGIEGNAAGISAEAFFNLLEIYKGDVRISVQPFGDKLKLSGHAGLSVQIPRLPAETSGIIGGALNKFLPITLAEVSTSFDEKRIAGSMVYPPVPFKISATITLDDAGKAKFDMGLEFTLFNKDAGTAGGRMTLRELPYAMRYENKPAMARQGHLEGQSIVINSRVSPQGRALDVENTEFPFSLNGGLEAVIIRVEGVDEVPVFSVVLPTGQEVNAENALDMGYLHTVYEERNQAHIVLANTLSGDYKIKIAGSGEYEIDIAGAEFGPALSFEEINHNAASNTVAFSWNDEDLDSDASVSFFYDTDQEGGDGQIIVAELSEDDETDQYDWDVSGLDNGTYYVYGIIDDGMSTPAIVYAAEPIMINSASAIAIPVLEAATVVAPNVDLSWSAMPGAHHYLVYYAEEKAVSTRSQVFNAGQKDRFSVPDLKPGRTYQFAVAVVDSNRVQSNLSNVLELAFISETINNVPRIDASGLPDHVKVGETWEATVSAADGDPEDVLSYLLTRSPEGMTINDNIISWTPTEAQVGANQVALKVQDPDLAADSIRFSITVINEKSSKASLSFNRAGFNGLDKTVQVSLQDAGLNASSTSMESQVVRVFSTADRSGISVTLKETSANSGAFVGTFGFADGASSEGLIGVAVADSVFVAYSDAFPEEVVTRFVLFEASATPNELPSSISINNTSISSSAKPGDLVGILATVDADDDTHSYQLVKGVGDDDNALFKIDGQALVLNASLAGIDKAEWMVRVRTIDPKNGFFEETIILSNTAVLGNKPNALLNEVTLYPNPTSRKVFVTIDSEKGAIKVTVLSSAGKRLMSEVFEKNWNDSKVSMNVSDLPDGIYFIQIEQQGQVVNRRLIKGHL